MIEEPSRNDDTTRPRNDVVKTQRTALAVTDANRRERTERFS
jgi:hypothetical protein